MPDNFFCARWACLKTFLRSYPTLLCVCVGGGGGGGRGGGGSDIMLFLFVFSSVVRKIK